MFGGCKNETSLRTHTALIPARRLCPDHNQHYHRTANADSDSDSTHAHAACKSAFAAKFDQHPTSKIHIRTNCHARTPADDIVIIRILYRVD